VPANHEEIPVKKTLKHRLIDILPTGNILTKTTRRADLTGLIGRLHPKDVGIELIRMGPQGDGGYLIPDDLEGIGACFSPGVSTVSDFELGCAQRGMQVYLADYSVDGPATPHDSFSFIKKFVGATTSEQFITLNDWVQQSDIAPDVDLILQMDIEGFEYETLLSIPDDLMKRFRIIVIEFHRLHHLWGRPFFRLASAAFAKLLQTHTVLHLHPNNCRSSFYRQGLEIPRVMEFTFLRNDRFDSHRFANRFPHPLDNDNTPKETVILPDCWYRQTTPGTAA
jgi:hypothetical protein